MISVLVLPLITMVLPGCGTTPLTPSQTAQHFWAAMLNGDVNKAADYATPESEPQLNEHIGDYKQATVSFGQVSIKSDTATVETTLQLDKPPSSSSTRFTTTLQREREQWRVNYPQTRQSLLKASEKKGLDKLVDDLNELGQRFSGKVEESLKDLKQATPEMKKHLEEMGKSVQKDVQDAIEKYGPKIQRDLQDLTESLDDALKELNKPAPEKQPSPPSQPDSGGSEAETPPEGRMI
jgi:hypothetical protein